MLSPKRLRPVGLFTRISGLSKRYFIIVAELRPSITVHKSLNEFFPLAIDSKISLSSLSFRLKAVAL